MLLETACNQTNALEMRNSQIIDGVISNIMPMSNMQVKFVEFLGWCLLQKKTVSVMGVSAFCTDGDSHFSCLHPRNLSLA